MVGMSGRIEARLALLTPRAFNLPERTCGSAENSVLTSTGTWPDMTAVIAGPPPLYGTGMISTPAISLNSSPAKLETPPALEDAYWRCPGLAFASAMRSFRELICSPGHVAIMFGPVPISAIGASDFSGSYGSFFCVAGVMVYVVDKISNGE